MPDTCACSRPVTDTNICQPCADDLSRALTETPFLIDQLDTVITRQTVYASRSDGSRSTDRPLPFHVAASATKRDLSRALETACTTLINTRHANSCPISPQPFHTSFWLTLHLHQIRAHDAAAEITSNILTPVRKARWLIDRPADRWYAGPCNNEISADTTDLCGTELYATAGRGDVECPVCGAVYDVGARRDWLLAAAEDQLANAAVCARAISWLGETDLTPTLIRVWHQRGRLAAKGHEPYPTGTDPRRTRPLFRVGDVIDLVATQAAKTRKTTR